MLSVNEVLEIMREQRTESVYGYCPICGAEGVLRERRMNGNDRCENGHIYPSRDRFNTYQQYLNSKENKMTKEQIKQKINELQKLLNDEVTEYNIILDRSGSMSSIKDDMEGGFKEWIKKERELAGEARINLYQFDDQFDVVYENKSLNDVDNLNLQPRGSTALNDAIGKTIGLVRDRHNKSKPDKTVFVIITDGQENASREWTSSSVKSLVEEQVKQNCVFLYLGANQDVVLSGKDRGIGHTFSYQSNSTGTKHMWDNLHVGTRNLRSSSPQEYKDMAVGASDVFDSSKDNS